MTIASILTNTVTAAFMAWATPSDQVEKVNKATAPPKTISDNFQTKTVQVESESNVGGAFNYLKSDHFLNNAIQKLDKKFQFILDEIGAAENFNGPFNKVIRDPYSDDMGKIANNGGYNPLINPNTNRQIDICTSEETQRFFKKYEDKIDNFLNKDHPKYNLIVTPKVQETINSLKDDIQKLGNLNGIQRAYEATFFIKQQCNTLT